MSKIKNVLFTAAITLGTFGTVTYTSCSKDACKDVACSNGGTCVSGSCSCPSGYEGSNCSTESRAKYVGDYQASGTDNAGGTYTNWTLSFASSGTSVNTMTLTFKNTAGATVFSFPITVTFSSTSASTFIINSTTVGSFTYTGNGSLSTTTATVTVTQAGSPNLVITFNNGTRI